MGYRGRKTYFRTRHWTSVGSKVASDPDGARADLLAVLERYGGNSTRAAWDMGVTRRLVRYWVARLGVRDQLEDMRERAAVRRAQPNELIANARAALAPAEQPDR